MAVAQALTSGSVTPHSTSFDASCPISKIPFDILSPILASVIESAVPMHDYMSVADLKKRSAFIVHLRLLCRQWNDTIAATPSLWSRFFIPLQALRYESYPYIERGVTLQLARVGSMPLALDLDVPFSSIGRFKKLAVLLRPVLPRCRQLRFTSYYNPEVAAATRSFFQQDEHSILPVLDTLTMEWYKSAAAYHDLNASSFHETLSHILSPASLKSFELRQRDKFDEKHCLHLPIHDESALRTVLLGNGAFAGLTTLKVINFISPAIVLDLVAACTATLERFSWQTEWVRNEQHYAYGHDLSLRQVLDLPRLHSLSLSGIPSLSYLSLFRSAIRVQTFRMGMTFERGDMGCVDRFFTIDAVRNVVCDPMFFSYQGGTSLPTALSTSIDISFAVRPSTRLDSELATALSHLLQGAEVTRTLDLDSRDTGDDGSRVRVLVGYLEREEGPMDPKELHRLMYESRYTGIMVPMSLTQMEDYKAGLTGEWDIDL